MFDVISAVMSGAVFDFKLDLITFVMTSFMTAVRSDVSLNVMSDIILNVMLNNVFHFMMDVISDVKSSCCIKSLFMIKMKVQLLPSSVKPHLQQAECSYIITHRPASQPYSQPPE